MIPAALPFNRYDGGRLFVLARSYQRAKNRWGQAVEALKKAEAGGNMVDIVAARLLVSVRRTEKERLSKALDAAAVKAADPGPGG